MKQHKENNALKKADSCQTTSAGIKRALALVLSILLIAGLIPAVAFATETKDENVQVDETVVLQSEPEQGDESVPTEASAAEVSTQDEPSDPNNPVITDTFEVTFMVEGTEYAKVTVASGEKCPAQVQPVVGGKVFTGWFYEDEEHHLIPFDFTSTIINNDMEVVAYFEGETVMVRYMSSAKSNAVVLYTDQVPVGNIPSKVQVDIPSELIEPGYTFNNQWMHNNAPYDFSIAVNTDITLYPNLQKGYTVWFHTNGEPFEPQVVVANEKVTDPGLPVRAGYTATGKWYTDQACTSEFSLTTPVTQELNLYAGWTPNTDTPYEVHYYLERAGIPLNSDVAGGGLTEAQRKDRANFVFIDKEEKTGTTNEEVTVEKDEVPSSVITQIRTAMGSIISSSNYRDFAHYSYSTKTTISPNGSTVVEVFFERNIVELIYNLGTKATYVKSMTISKNGTTETFYPGELADQYMTKGKIGLADDYMESPFAPDTGTSFEFVEGYNFFGWGKHNTQYELGDLSWELTGYPGFDSPQQRHHRPRDQHHDLCV